MSAAPHHFLWDLDKTYLRTEFDTVVDLVRTFRQTAEEKTNVPGARALLKALLRSGEGQTGRSVSFISGSPNQMRKVLSRKLALDGIEPDDFVLKPTLSNVLRFRFRAIRNQVGYKLGALLNRRLPERPASETLFGDDAEMDAFIYSLYADLLAGSVPIGKLEQVLASCRLYPSTQTKVLESASAIEPNGSRVDRIFIHLDRRSPPARFDAYGPRVVPVFNYFQAALVLGKDAMLSSSGLVSVVGSMVADGYTQRTLVNSAQDLVRRGHLDGAGLAELARRVRSLEETALPAYASFAHDFIEACIHAVSQIKARPSRFSADRPIDYLALSQHDKFKPVKVRVPLFKWLE